MEQKVDYRSSHQGKNHGADYDAVLYKQDTYDSRVWDLEKEILAEILAGKRFGNYLDFACGTGRITSFLRAFAEKTAGVDVAEEMLKEARVKCPGVDFVLADYTKNPPSEKFDLISAFRFFLNAEPALREEGARTMASLLAPGGTLVFNVHGNRTSWIGAYGVLRKLFQPSWTYNLMSHGQVKALMARHGLEIVESRCYGVLPFGHTLARAFFCPLLMSKFLTPERWSAAEKWIMRHFGWLRIGGCMAYVCKKQS